MRILSVWSCALLLLGACSDRTGPAIDAAGDLPVNDRAVADTGGTVDEGQIDMSQGDSSPSPDAAMHDQSRPNPDVNLCPPVPSCNWCGGKSIKNSQGCTVGYVCANGADPCKTGPCTATSCGPGYACGKDMLCWPTSVDATITPPMDGGPPVKCGSKMCSGSSSGACSCKWTCTDGNTYETDCQPTAGAMFCTCKKNATQSGVCSSSGGINACTNNCCGFPM